jgi:tRNA(Met) cytidine acetyltransferase
LAHAGLSDAYSYRYWRISRIAVAAERQRQGIGSALIGDIERQAQECGVDLLCTSFAYDRDVLSFWQSLGFCVVRIGVSKDKSSGTYSVMMAKALTEQAKTSLANWSAEFRHHFVLGLPLRVQDLDLASCWQLTRSLDEANETLPLSETLRHHLDLFARYSRPLETVQTLLWQALQPCWLSSNRAETILLLTQVAFGEIHTGNCQQFGFHGKKEFVEQIRRHVAWLIDRDKK